MILEEDLISLGITDSNAFKAGEDAVQSVLFVEKSSIFFFSQ